MSAKLTRRDPGQPTKYKPEYPEMLIEHMKKGNSFESFGAVCHCSVASLMNWQNSHEEFFLARKVGLTYLRRFYEELGKTIATGQLRRLVSEKPMVDAMGNAMYDASGQIMMERTYAPAIPNAAVFIFMTKNILGWRNEVNLTFQEIPPNSDAAPTPIEEMATDRLKARMKQLMLKAAEDDPEMMEAIRRGVNAAKP